MSKEDLKLTIKFLLVVLAITISSLILSSVKARNKLRGINACYSAHQVIEYRVLPSGIIECKLSQDGNVSHWAITEVK